MHKTEILRLIDHYLDRLSTVDNEQMIQRYEDFVDYLTEAIVKDLFI